MGRPIAVIAALVLLGCNQAATQSIRPDAGAARDAWIEALAAADADRVWAMISADSRARWTDKDAFTLWCKRRCSDLLVDAMSRSGDPVEVLSYADGTRLVLEGGKWRVLHIDIGGGDSPLAALKRFRASAGGALTPRVTAALDALITKGAEALQVDGKRARATLGKDGEVRLVKSEAGWRVDGWNSPD